MVLHTDPTAHSELLAVRDAARRLGTRDLSDCDVYSTATPCAMCQGALYWARVRRVFTESTLEHGIAPKLRCRARVTPRRSGARRATSRTDCAGWAERTARQRRGVPADLAAGIGHRAHREIVRRIGVVGELALARQHLGAGVEERARRHRDARARAAHGTTRPAASTCSASPCSGSVRRRAGRRMPSPRSRPQRDRPHKLSSAWRSSSYGWSSLHYPPFISLNSADRPTVPHSPAACGFPGCVFAASPAASIWLIGLS